MALLRGGWKIPGGVRFIRDCYLVVHPVAVRLVRKWGYRVWDVRGVAAGGAGMAAVFQRRLPDCGEGVIRTALSSKRTRRLADVPVWSQAR